MPKEAALNKSSSCNGAKKPKTQVWEEKRRAKTGSPLSASHRRPAPWQLPARLLLCRAELSRGCRASRGSGRWVHDASATAGSSETRRPRWNYVRVEVRRMGSVWSHLWEPQCGQGAGNSFLSFLLSLGCSTGHSLLGGDDESSLNARCQLSKHRPKYPIQLMCCPQV